MPTLIHREPLRAIAVPTIGLERRHRSRRSPPRDLALQAVSGRTPSPAQRPIDFNYAELFPLTDPKYAAYRHVERSSVRRLLQRFDRRNGVRLWCSVRRSGKTTASASDLGATSESAVVISETCDHTGRHSGTNFVYTAIQKALAEGEHIPNDFFRSALSEATGGLQRCCSASRSSSTSTRRYSATCGAASRETPTVRYTVVQPLLDQMVEFADQNLIVFLGQQPDAHYMLMSQNQLSAYVEQDQFPLFSHDADNYRGEFQELLQRVLTNLRKLRPLVRECRLRRDRRTSLPDCERARRHVRLAYRHATAAIVARRRADRRSLRRVRRGKDEAEGDIAATRRSSSSARSPGTRSARTVGKATLGYTASTPRCGEPASTTVPTSPSHRTTSSV